MRSLFLLTSLLFFSISFSSYTFAEDTTTTNAGDTEGKITTNKKLQMAENNPVAGVACKAYKLLTHGMTKAIITLLFIITGLGFFIGKVSWGIVISLLIGTALTLTSGKLVQVFVGDAGAGGGDGDVCECKYGLDDVGNCKSPFVS